MGFANKLWFLSIVFFFWRQSIKKEVLVHDYNSEHMFRGNTENIEDQKKENKTELYTDSDSPHLI